MNFREATDQLFLHVDHGALASKLSVSVASIRQARLSPEASAHRPAPKGWERAVLALADQQIEHLERLAETLRNDQKKVTRPVVPVTKGRPIIA